MDEIIIRSLGRSRNEVGNHLELLTKEMLAGMGFGGFIRNAHQTGAEIDLKANHRVTSAPLLCECKAHDRPLGTRAVRLFHSEWIKERRKDNRLFGMIISTGGFNGTAKQWYSELDQKTKKHFVLLDSGDLLKQLIEGRLTLDPQAISAVLKERYAIGVLQDYWLTYSQHGFVWIYTYVVDDGSKYFTMVDATGQALPTWKTKEIIKLSRRQLRGSNFFGLDLRNKVQQELLKTEGTSAREIAEVTRESLTDVSLALNILAGEGRIRLADNGNEYYFVRDLFQFVNAARDFLPTDDAVLLLSSEFARDLIQSEQLMSYLDSRYQLGMKSPEQVILRRLLLISPSALEYVLFAEPARYVRFFEHVNELKMGENDRKKWLDLHRTTLLRETSFRAIHDLTGEKTDLSSLLAKLGIKRVRIQARLDAVGLGWDTLSVQSETQHAIEMAGEGITAGSLVTYSNPAEFEMWNGLLSLEVGEYEAAEKELRDAWAKAAKLGVADTALKQAILTNLALALMRQKKWEEAQKFLNEAFTLGSPNHPELFTNLVICLVELGDMQKANEIVEQALTIFPSVEDSEAVSRYREAKLHTKSGE
jgi:tetratricopeptide (TPR) repeat protein